MSLIDEITDTQLEYYNAKLQAAREVIANAGLTVTEDQIAERAREIMQGDTLKHTYTPPAPPLVEQADE